MPATLTQGELRELAALVAAELADRNSRTPELLDSGEAREYVGLRKTAWHALRSAGRLPKPVDVQGAGLRWRKRDLDEWLRKLKAK